MLEFCYDIVIVDGWVPGVGGLFWRTERSHEDGVVKVYLLYCGTRCDPFFLAKQRNLEAAPTLVTEQECTMR